MEGKDFRYTGDRSSYSLLFISKADFVDMIKKGNCPTAKVHIQLID